ncbi:MAG TPA: DUF5685 family protein [Phnomibacter sp.]|nr:DUF5685 family protein [Phnomibacter sp.]
MFGLLKHRPPQPELRADHRKNYCGTCKAIGKMYGHKQRLLLNHDVVFLSELLAGLADGRQDMDAISVYRCFSLPKHVDQLPPYITYTASINMLLASIKIYDNINDSGRMAFFWRSMAFFQKKQFAKARLHLEGSGLSMDIVDAHVAEQAKRERSRKYFSGVEASCEYYAEMTGSLSGEIFKSGAITAGRPTSAEDMFMVGKAYGELVYLADALTDRQMDRERGAFNPLFTVTIDPMPDATEVVYELIAIRLLTIKKHLYKLPIADAKKRSFFERLDRSIHSAIFKIPACAPAASCQKQGLSIYQQYHLARARALRALAPANPKRLKLAGATFAASILAFVILAFPFRLFANASTPAPPSDCWQECIDDTIQNCCECICDSICDSICNASR